MCVYMYMIIYLLFMLHTCSLILCNECMCAYMHTRTMSASMRVCVCVSVYVSVCVCACARAHVPRLRGVGVVQRGEVVHVQARRPRRVGRPRAERVGAALRAHAAQRHCKYTRHTSYYLFNNGLPPFHSRDE